jgi:hypothetical protein
MSQTSPRSASAKTSSRNRRLRLWCLVTLALNIAIFAGMTLHERLAAQATLRQTEADVAAIDAQVAQLDVIDNESMAYMRAGWRLDFSAAVDESKKTGRPIFLYTMKGRIDGRC